MSKAGKVSPPVEVREIQANDFASYQDFLFKLDEQASFVLFEPGQRTKDRDHWLNLVNQSIQQPQNRPLFVAVSKGRVIGFLGANRGAPPSMRHVANFAIGLLHGYRRQGYGRQLMQKLLKWAECHGVRRLEMTVMKANVDAVAFYKNLGFVTEGCRVGSIRRANGEVYDELWIARYLVDAPDSHLESNREGDA